MKKSILIKTFLSVLGVLMVLTGILVYHIYSVTRTKNDFRTTRQLSRIDFTQPLDSGEATKVRYYVGSLEGVESTHFNYASNILVYSYFPEKQSSENVFALVQKFGKYPAKKYEVNAEDLAKGCPAIDKNSFTYRSSSFVSNLMNQPSSLNQ